MVSDSGESKNNEDTMKLQRSRHANNGAAKTINERRLGLQRGMNREWLLVNEP